MQRCKAKSKRSGDRCRNYAVNGWSVCRMHGARGGPNTAKGLTICKMAALKHGHYSKESRLKRQKLRQLLKNKDQIDEIKWTHCPKN